MLGSRSLHLTVALGGTHSTQQSAHSTVRLEVSHYRAEECLQRAEVKVQVIIGTARGLIGSELRIAAHGCDILLIADARSASHELQGFLNADDRQHEEVAAVLGSRFLVVLECESKFSHCFKGLW